MADRELDINLKKGSTASTLESAMTSNPSSDEVKEYKARMASVRERGLISDRLHVDLPPDVHGEWCPIDTAEIARLEMLGFRIDDQYAPKRRLHDKGDGKSIVSDVVHMIQPKWMHDILEEQRKEAYRETHLKKRQKEESDFIANQKQIGEDVNTKIASTAENLPGHELTERLSNKG